MGLIDDIMICNENQQYHNGLIISQNVITNNITTWENNYCIWDQH